MDGVYETFEVEHSDSRGVFYETFKNPEDIDFKYFCSVTSKPKVIRGLHYRLTKQVKFLHVLWGEIFDVVLDMRKDSDTFGKYETRFMTPGIGLLIPFGVAHGYQVISRNVGAKVEYYFSDYYRPEHERIVLYNDPYLEIPWPLKSGLVSDKDRDGLLFVNSEYL